MALEDVLQGFDRLTNSLREVNIAKSLGDAQDQVSQLQANQNLSDFEKMRAQHAIAQAAGARVMQLGGNAFSAQQTMAALAPQPIDKEAATLEATGASTAAEGMKLEQQRQEAAKAKEAEQKVQGELRVQELKNKGLIDLAGIKNEKPQPLNPKALEPLAKNKTTAAEFNRLADMTENLKPSEVQAIFAKPIALRTPDEQKLVTTVERVKLGDIHSFFGARLTEPELNRYKQIVPNFSGGLVDPKVMSQGFRAIAQIGKDGYLRQIDDYAAANVGKESELNKLIVSSKDALGLEPQEIKAYLNRRTQLGSQLQQVQSNPQAAAPASQPPAGQPVGGVSNIPGLKF